MSQRLNQFLGDTPFRVLIRLLALSFIVGLVLSVIGLHPFEIFEWVERVAQRIYNMGFDVIREAFNYLFLGALIVVPVFLIMRLMKATNRRSGG
ncbi:MAG TPA: DUF6460 domain-containing protein [Afifellaceae bacterium]|nr:DUF6460 domain-containing protein [Afifellaceae bacterium]